MWIIDEGHSEIKDYLNQIASNPRSLQSISSIKVSDLLGCHSDRKSRALSLSLPIQLVRKVLFYDVLYPAEGFVEDEPKVN